MYMVEIQTGQKWGYLAKKRKKWIHGKRRDFDTLKIDNLINKKK